MTREVAEVFGFKEIRTPTFEHTELFQRGVGGTTDVVQKEMYTFSDKKGRSITLKPEGTAGAVRAALEHGLLNAALPQKLFYYTSCFRYEAPQSGRLREHHQFGAEVFGAKSPLADAEVISLAKTVLDRLGFKDVSLEINSIGCPECRKSYLEALRGYFAPFATGEADRLCATCLDRLERNPMRLLDCKSEVCRSVNKDAPNITDFLCGECREHFSSVREYLMLFGIGYKINPRIVRGLDYYTNTVFEFIPNAVGSQTTICAGGRYNGLVEELGGSPCPGLGFGMGLERLILEMERQNLPFEVQPRTCDLYFAALDECSAKKAAELVFELRRLGGSAECDLAGRGLRAQMKYADKIGAKTVAVVGSAELEAEEAVLKEMAGGKREFTVKLNAADSLKCLE